MSLPESWQTVEFGSVLEGGTRNGIYKPPQYRGRGFKMVNMGELFAYPRLRDVPMSRIELNASEVDRFTLRVGDLLFARRSLVAEGAGKCSVVCEMREPLTFESSIIRARPVPETANSLFLFYLFASPIGKYLLDTILRQVAVSGITGTDLLKLKIPLPPLLEQRAIAAVLGALDDKIELNRRINATLEEMARTVFNSWFLDFDPVHARASGHHPGGMSPKVAAQFPDKFYITEMGDIPIGWEVKTVDEVAERVAMGPFGSSIKVETFAEDGIPIISGQHLRGLMLEDKDYNYITVDHADDLKRANVQRGDVIFTHAGNVGNLALIPADSEYERYVVSQRQFYMRCNLSRITPEFITLYFQSPEGQNRLLANMAPVGVPSIAQPVTYLKSIKLVIPSRPILDQFTALVSPLLRRYRANVRESRTLAALRDTLLPKLMSGEVRVKI